MTKKEQAMVREEMCTTSLMQYVAVVPDLRIERSRLHSLPGILRSSLWAIICGPDSFVAIDELGEAKEDSLKTFLDFSHRIPSHDTLGRVFAALSPAALSAAFREWVAAVARLTEGEVVAIGGKILPRSFRAAGRDGRSRDRRSGR